ncbi:uncharacterized protein LOC112639324 [Camponotus floridanus]|uniref:uncharacterized protein LOC112637163 n=1 Tax=Camponotus floridanus TaxID=104421 RepID=UPI000DC6861D|nr:uncharacterized protein LOC112637163 [Camponotus floridanus]XP_025265400.1 uncharacterized protein LOC112638243 [Camponotus floridanus]XP_025268597.1 uncharacterized protein LOC112639324 [Camponotus floridanus]
MQRNVAIRVISAYRTVSTDAALLLARIPPTHIHAAYYRRTFIRANDSKRDNTWNPLVEKEIKNGELVLMRRQWKLYLQRRDAAGRCTLEAILPYFEQWLDRSHGVLTFYITQMLTGHGCFATYLYRIGKANTAICTFCKKDEDSPEHTIQVCEQWTEERALLVSVIGNDLSLRSIIGKVLVSEENWEAFHTFAEKVMLSKENDERARERAAEASDSGSAHANIHITHTPDRGCPKRKWTSSPTDTTPEADLILTREPLGSLVHT